MLEYIERVILLIKFLDFFQKILVYFIFYHFHGRESFEYLIAVSYTHLDVYKRQVQSIMNLYSRKHVLEGARIDVKMAELKKELEAAKKLPAVTGYDEEQKNYYSFLSSVESFMKDMQKARDKGAYSDADYNAMSEAYEYGLSVI